MMEVELCFMIYLDSACKQESSFLLDLNVEIMKLRKL